MNGYLLDTHVWIWIQEGVTQKLSSEFLAELEVLQRRRELAVSAISILEIARLVALNQYNLATSVEKFVAEGTTADGLRLLDLSPSVLIASTRLPGDIHRDPSDRLLVATAIEHDLTLVTDDGKLLLYAKQVIFASGDPDRCARILVLWPCHRTTPSANPPPSTPPSHAASRSPRAWSW